jgi:hypothetical protein
MNCEVFNCRQDITHGNLVCINLDKVDVFKGTTQKVKMLVSVCDNCISKYKAEDRVRGSIDVEA